MCIPVVPSLISVLGYDVSIMYGCIPASLFVILLMLKFLIYASSGRDDFRAFASFSSHGFDP